LTNGLTIESFHYIWPVLVLIVTLGLLPLGAIFAGATRAPQHGRSRSESPPGGRPRVIERAQASAPSGSRTLLVGALAGLAVAVFCALRLNPLSPIGHPQSSGWLSDYLFFDPLYLFAIVFLCVFLAGVLLLSAALWRQGTWEWPVFLSLLLGSLVGMILLASARHLLFFAIALEMASLPSYVLVGFRRFNSKSAEGAAKYAIFGAVCSALMLYGISLLYGVTGSFDWEKVARHLATAGVAPLALAALSCLFIGLAFKISLVPMHFWCPDAFEAAGADVAAWLSIASKSAALFALARLARLLLPSLTPVVQQHILLALAVVAVVTMTVANLSAYWQTSVKRLLAYSSIAHAGYITCGVLVFSDAAGIGAIVAYVLVYLLMNLGAFSVAGLVEAHSGTDHLDGFAGLGARNPRLAIVMTFFLFSLVGLPPLAGFAAKWILLAALWSHQLIFVTVAILANTLLSLFYYLRLTRAMYFTRSDLAPVRVPTCAAAVLTFCGTGLLALFFGWGLLSNLSLRLFALAR
jgi:NADH-quinone oxidoreductase subunit N